MAGKILILDVETFGLNLHEDYMLELGMMLVDSETFRIEHQFSGVIVEDPDRAFRLYNAYRGGYIETTDPEYWVAKTHSENGLLEAVIDLNEAEPGEYRFEDVEIAALQWLTRAGVTEKMNMCGASIQFDRARVEFYMPNLAKQFTYRNEDLSSVKMLASKWAPEKVKEMENFIGDQPETHRVLQCMRNTIGQLEAYKTFLFS